MALWSADDEEAIEIAELQSAPQAGGGEERKTKHAQPFIWQDHYLLPEPDLVVFTMPWAPSITVIVDPHAVLYMGGATASLWARVGGAKVKIDSKTIPGTPDAPPPAPSAVLLSGSEACDEYVVTFKLHADAQAVIEAAVVYWEGAYIDVHGSTFSGRQAGARPPAAGVVSGSASASTTLENVSIGDVVVAAADDPTQLRRATLANLRASGIVKGIALSDAAAGSVVAWGGVGTVLEESVVGLGAGQHAFLVVNTATARPVRKKYIDAGDYVVGSINAAGQPAVSPHRSIQPRTLNLKAAPYNAIGTDAGLGDAAEDAKVHAWMADFQALGVPGYAPEGRYWLLKPMHLHTVAARMSGEYGIGQTQFAAQYCGPLLMVTPSIKRNPAQTYEEFLFRPKHLANGTGNAFRVWNDIGAQLSLGRVGVEIGLFNPLAGCIEYTFTCTEAVTGGDQYILGVASYGKRFDYDTEAIAFRLRIMGTGVGALNDTSLSCTVTIGGIVYGLNDPNPLTVGEKYHFAVQYDQATGILSMRRGRIGDANGTIVARFTGVAGEWKAQRWENMVTGSCLKNLAEGGGPVLLPHVGHEMSAMRMSTVTRYAEGVVGTTYAIPTTEWDDTTPDINTDFVCNFAEHWGMCVRAGKKTGLQGFRRAWLPTKYGDIVSTDVNSVVVEDLAFVGNAQYANLGIFTQLARNSRFSRLFTVACDTVMWIDNNNYNCVNEFIGGTGGRTNPFPPYGLVEAGQGHSGQYRDVQLQAFDFPMVINGCAPCTITNLYILQWSQAALSVSEGYYALVSCMLSNETMPSAPKWAALMGGFDCNVSALNCIFGTGFTGVNAVKISAGSNYVFSSCYFGAHDPATDVPIDRLGESVGAPAPIAIVLNGCRWGSGGPTPSLGPVTNAPVNEGNIWINGYNAVQRVDDTGVYQTGGTSRWAWTQKSAGVTTPAGSGRLEQQTVRYAQVALAAETSWSYALPDGAVTAAVATIEIRSGADWARFRIAADYNRNAGGAPAGAATADPSPTGSNGGGPPVGWACVFDVSVNALRVRSTAAAGAIVSGVVELMENRSS